VRAKDRERVMAEVVQRVTSRVGETPQQLEQALFDTLYDERRRLEAERDRNSARRELALYDHLQARALKAGPEEHRDILREIVGRFAQEVAGHFDERIYHLTTKVVPTALTLLFNAVSPLKLLQQIPSGLSRLDDQLEISGETEALKRAVAQGTAVLVPTHASHMDSILVGYMLYRLGLPPFVYGAGLNLFHNKLIGFFMHNLGAYKVDRKKKAEIYKEVLKTYAGVSIELGYHNLFFPGGTRSRSGAVESRLKLGLLGMGLDAYVRSLRAGSQRPDVFIVPCTINYQLVLEAETLIDDHLKEVGKSRYIIEDDEFSKPRRVFEFVSRLFDLQSRIHIRVSRPLDPFGNQVDDQGRSLDARGRAVDRRRYVLAGDAPGFDAQRDQEYTRELSRAIVEAFRRDTVFGSVHLVAWVVFRWLQERNRGLDLYRLLRTGGTEASMPLLEAYRRIEHVREAMRREEAAGHLRLDATLRDGDSVQVLADALAHLRVFHVNPALERRGDQLLHIDRNLLLYYQNRLADRGLPPEGVPA
jgi:glycerol-3-phosphate O-acyltransferase